MKMIKHLKLSGFTLALMTTMSVAAVAQTDDAMQAEVQKSNLNFEFVEPDRFTDIRPSNQSRSKYRDHVFESMQMYFAEFADSLPAGQTLIINITDIDLAGDTRSPRVPIGSTMFDVRVMEDIYFPRIEFSYMLKDEAGVEIQSGEANVKDMSYLSRASFVRSNRDAFPYERHMLEEWFDDTFKLNNAPSQ